MKIVLIILTIIFFLNSFILAKKFSTNHEKKHIFLLKKYVILCIPIISILIYAFFLDFKFGLIITYLFIVNTAMLFLLFKINVFSEILQGKFISCLSILFIIFMEVMTMYISVDLPFNNKSKQVSKNNIVINLEDYNKNSKKLLIIVLEGENENLKTYAVKEYDSNSSIDFPYIMHKNNFEECNIYNSAEEKIVIEEKTTQYESFLSYFELTEEKVIYSNKVYKLYLDSDSIKHN